MDGEPCWTGTVLAGPDAGATATLGVGRHVVGRAAALALRCDDPAWAPHQAVVEIGPDGGAWLVALAGRTPLRVGGVDLLPGASAALGSGGVIEIGGSLVRWERGRPATPVAADIRRGVVHRGPRAVPVWAPDPIVPPAAPAPPVPVTGGLVGLVPSLLGLGAAAMVALVLASPMFVVFGAVGACAGAGSWAAQRIAAARAARANRLAQQAAAQAAVEALRRQLRCWTAHHLATVPTAVGVRAHLGRFGADLWCRRRVHADAGVASLGWGDVDWAPVLGAEHTTADPAWSAALVDARPEAPLPVAADLAGGRHIAVRGPRPASTAVVRSLVLQQVVACGPADLRVVVVTERPIEWEWVARLPHAAVPGGGVAVVGPDGLVDAVAALAGHPARRLVVLDRSEWLADRTSAVRRMLVEDREVATLTLVETDTTVPHLCTGVLHLGRSGLASWQPDVHGGGLPVRVWPAGVALDAATRLARQLAGCVDPEDPTGDAGSLPGEVRLADLLAGAGGLTATAVAAAWRARTAAPEWRAPIGRCVDGGRVVPLEIDLVRDGPHGLVAGTTGSGKSELLRSLVVALALRVPPERVTFLLVDYKGGATFDACAALPHVVGTVTDLDDRLGARALRSLAAELRHRETVLRDHGASDVGELHVIAPQVVLPRLVVVVDEFAALAAEHPGLLDALVGVAQRGRSLGIHLLLATQRPAGVVSDDIRANTELRIALRLADAAEARDVVGDDAPARLPRRVPGRAVLRVGPTEPLMFQVATCTTGGPTSDLARLVGLARDAARLTDAPPPRRPWCDPLPVELSPSAPGVLGVVDEPDRQATSPLRWEWRGHLLVAGSHGAGATSALVSLAHEALAAGAHVYVVDTRGDDRLAALVGHPGCGAVVRLGERERVRRLLARLAAQAGSGDDPPGVPTVLVVDGLDELRRALDTPLDSSPWEDVLTVLTRGSTVGLRMVASVSQPSALPAAVGAHVSERWVLHLDDPAESAAAGVSPAHVPPRVPGRLVVASSGLEAQLARPATEPPPAPPGAAAAPAIGVLPALVAASELPPPSRDARGTPMVAVGVRFDDLGPAMVPMGQRDHLLVAGPPGSGRTAALVTLSRAWQRAYPDGWCGVLSPWSAWPATGVAEHADVASLVHAYAATTRPRLVVVDDAEAVDDPTGALAAGAADGRITVLAAGSVDGLRSRYGHWTDAVRRSRSGLLLAGCSDLDGDLLGAVLPRAAPLRTRPGLGWLVVRGSATLVQMACHERIAAG